jgi:fructose 1,6-bisphosphatase
MAAATSIDIPKVAAHDWRHSMSILTISPFEPGRLAMEDMEFTTMPQVAERMRERREPIAAPAPVAA